MKTLRLLTVAALGMAGFAQSVPPKSAFVATLIANAEARISKAPAIADGYNDLAFAMARRWRETEDPAYWLRAEQAIRTALQLDPHNFDARKARVILRVQQRRFADAEEEGRALNRQTPDDNLLYGLLADIAIATGNYTEAEEKAQRMIDLRQVNGPGLQRAGRLREIIGFPDAAAEAWNSALRLASSADVEERAFILTQLAGLCRRRSKLDEAERYVKEALALEPAYPAGLEEQGLIALDAGKSEQAEQLFRQRLEQNEGLSARYWLTECLALQGKLPAAEGSAAIFQQNATRTQDRLNLLIRFLAQHADVAAAVALGERLARGNIDLDTRQEYAMALLSAGNAAEAWKQMELVLKSGLKSPEFFLHAARTRQRLADPDGARIYLKKCIEANATSRFADLAFQELQGTRAKALEGSSRHPQ